MARCTFGVVDSVLALVLSYVLSSPYPLNRSTLMWMLASVGDNGEMMNER